MEIHNGDYLQWHECHWCKVPLAFRNAAIKCDNCGRLYGILTLTDTPDGKFSAAIRWHTQGDANPPSIVTLEQVG